MVSINTLNKTLNTSRAKRLHLNDTQKFLKRHVLVFFPWFLQTIIPILITLMFYSWILTKDQETANTRPTFWVPLQSLPWQKIKQKDFTKTDSKQEQLFLRCYCSDQDLCYTMHRCAGPKKLSSWSGVGMIVWCWMLVWLIVLALPWSDLWQDRALGIVLTSSCLLMTNGYCASIVYSFTACWNSRTLPTYILDICCSTMYQVRSHFCFLIFITVYGTSFVLQDWRICIVCKPFWESYMPCYSLK